MSIINRYSNFLHTGTLMLLITILFKVLHWPAVEMLWYFTLFYTLVYVAIGISLVVRDKEKDNLVKGAWAIGLLLIPPIIGLIYYHSEIKGKNAST